MTMTTSELSRIHQERARAQAWRDECKLSTIKARMELNRAQDDEATAIAALEAMVLRERRAEADLSGPVALREAV